ncbi:TlpA family protein disulfide reductase [Streptomyces sp. NPDC060194]|uniref:TlpA family protein disulfide reductase n=1 Tax=Streptomyces sp. NPDC060194 TaxID=3347069 RepID=UPI003661A47F
MALIRAPRRHALRSGGRRPRIALATAGIAVAALTLSACGGDNPGSTGAGGTKFITGKTGVETVAEGDRKPAPTLDGKTLQGTALSTDDYKGKVVVLNVWGSWCAPCRAEAKYLQEVSQETKDKGVQFVGINTRDPEKGPAIAFEEEQGVTYPSLHDPTGKLLLRFPKGSLSATRVPSTLVLDREGRIAARSLTRVNDTDLRRMIDPLLAEK